MNEEILLRELYKRNLKEYMSMWEFNERVRIVDRSGKRNATVGNGSY